MGTAKGVRPRPARPLGWQDRAACIGTSLDLWFPVEVGQGVPAQAREICDTCPVRAECLTYALNTPEHGPEYGIWANTTEDDRRAIRRHAQRAALAADRSAAAR